MVAGLEGCRVEVEVFDGKRALACVPAVGQQDSANIEEDHVEGEGCGDIGAFQCAVRAMNA